MKSVDTNNLEYLRDLKSTFSELKALRNLYSNPLKPKNWTDAWLGLRYGTRLTYSDTRKNIDALLSRASTAIKLAKRSFFRSHAQLTEDIESRPKDFITGSRHLTYKIYYKSTNKVVDDVMRELAGWGLDPSLSNLWDLLPLSFTVDWIANIGKLLEQEDAKNFLDLIKILGVTYGNKETYTGVLDLSAYKFQPVDFVITHYQRSTSPRLHESKRILTWGSANELNIIDAISLIISNKNQKS